MYSIYSILFKLKSNYFSLDKTLKVYPSSFLITKIDFYLHRPKIVCILKKQKEKGDNYVLKIKRFDKNR